MGCVYFLEVINSAVNAVVEVLGEQRDWGPSGLRPGQYAFDLTADAAAVRVLHEGGLRVLSEESGADTKPGTIAVIDPVDGSTNASRGLPCFATSICVVDDSGPLVSVVYNHGTGERYTASRGRGARRDGVSLTPRTPPPLPEAVIAVNGLPSAHGGWAQYRVLGSAALEICAVADGRLDGYIDFSEGGLGPWDYLGALLVCKEAGVDACDARGRDLVTLDGRSRLHPVVASHPLMDDLMRVRAEHPDVAGARA